MINLSSDRGLSVLKRVEGEPCYGEGCVFVCVRACVLVSIQAYTRACMSVYIWMVCICR